MYATEQLYDVVVCGAGPTGLLAAYCLSRAGLKVFVAEKHGIEDQNTYGRATTLLQRTLELLDQIDLYEDVSQVGVVSRHWNNWDKDGNREPARGWQSLFTKAEPTFFDFCLHIRQRFSEDIYRGRVIQCGGIIMNSCAIESFARTETGSNPVEVVLKYLDSGETTRIYCRYLIGADGASSTIRKLAEIPFEGDTTARKWVRIDGIIKTTIPQDRSTGAALESRTHGNVLYVNIDRGAARVGYALSDELASKYGEKLTEKEAILEAKKAVMPFEIEFSRVDWFTTYGLRQQVAASFCKDQRIFLAGDAAHVHSSGIAQGMNTGIYDAINLSWKLAGVLKCLYSPSILSSYETERRPSALNLIALDKRITRLISNDQDPSVTQGRDMNALMAELLDAQRPFITGLGIEYGPSLVVASTVTAGTKAAGQRGPDALVRRIGLRVPIRLHEVLKNNARFHVIIFTGSYQDTLPHIKAIAESMKNSAFVENFGHALDLLTIMPGQKWSVYDTLGMINPFGRVFWDPDENAYAAYGIMEDGGIVVLRPDGYIGAAEMLNRAGWESIEKYFEGIVVKNEK